MFVVCEDSMVLLPDYHHSGIMIFIHTAAIHKYYDHNVFAG